MRFFYVKLDTLDKIAQNTALFSKIKMGGTKEKTRNKTKTEINLGRKINQEVADEFAKSLEIPAAQIQNLSKINPAQLQLEFKTLEAQTIDEIISQIESWIAVIKTPGEVPAEKISLKLGAAGKVNPGTAFAETTENDGGEISATDSRGIVAELKNPDSVLFRVLQIADFLRARITQIETGKSILLQSLRSAVADLEAETERISTAGDERFSQENEIQKEVKKLGGVFKEIAEDENFFESLRKNKLEELCQKHDSQNYLSTKEKIENLIPKNYRDNLCAENEFKNNEFENKTRAAVIQKLKTSVRRFSRLVAATQKFEEISAAILNGEFLPEKFFQKFGLRAPEISEMAQSLAKDIGKIFEETTTVERTVQKEKTPNKEIQENI